MRSGRDVAELQRKQADRRAREVAAVKDAETLEVLSRSVNYLAEAGKPINTASANHNNFWLVTVNQPAIWQCLTLHCFCMHSKPSKGPGHISRPWRG